MEDLLTTREVLDILKVDRITIYRMLQDGRIKGVKVGQQWRFAPREVERITGGKNPAPEPIQPRTDPGIPTHCVQTIQDLFSEVGQTSALVIDSEGVPLTEISRPCQFCQIMLQSLNGQAACRASWKELAKQSNPGCRYFTCHAGIQYVSAPILDHEKPIGYFLAGEFYWQVPDSHEEAERLRRLGSAYNLSVETLAEAANTIPVIETEQHAHLEAGPTAAARAVQSILHERIGFMERLEQIANLTKVQ